MGLIFTGRAFQEEGNLFSVIVSWSNMKHLEVALWEVPRFHARERSNTWSRTVSCILHVTWHPSKYSVVKTVVMTARATDSLSALETAPYL